MSRLESNLAEKFYGIINSIPTKRWWEFIRILGLPEHDIDEISYDDDDPTEQKYQMLSRWKNLFGYRQAEDDIMHCLNTASREILDQSGPEELNRILAGRLKENRLISKKFYAVMRELDSGQKKQFLRSKLNLPNHEVDRIKADWAKNIDEQCYQMLLAWKRRSNMQTYAEINEALGKFVDELNYVSRRTPDAGHDVRARNQPATGDVAGQPARHSAPSGDISPR